MSCKVKVNRHGYLALRVFWRGLRSWEGTGLADTPENRRLVEAQATIINAEMNAGTFDYLRHFPKGNRAPAPTPPIEIETRFTVGDYYRIWIERQKPPIVRGGTARDYREQFTRYILPKFENVKWSEVTPAALDDFRTYLITERNLSVKSCQNIINATFRACWRAASEIDGLPECQGKNPFAALRWRRQTGAQPDPFTEEERATVLEYFKLRVKHYYPFVLTQFLTGMRPSEALALHWKDVDFKRRRISIFKSRYMGENPTKTAASERDINLRPEVVEVLQDLFSNRPAQMEDDGNDYVFLNENGEPLDFRTWRGKTSGRKTKAGTKTPHGVWYRALRGAGVRPRGPYHTRHTFISIGLSNGANIKWLAEYCGTSIAMIERHYGKYIRSDIDEQLARIIGQSATLVQPWLESDEWNEGSTAKIKEKVGGPTWTRTRDQPVMSRWL
jgi:integrase